MTMDQIEGAPAAPTGGAYMYRASGGLARWAVWLTWTNVAATLLGAAGCFYQADMLRRSETVGVSDWEADFYPTLMLLTPIVPLVALLVWLVLFLCWSNRFNKNTRAMGIEGLTFTPGWTVGWWFIPVANIFQPYRALSELWRANDPANRGDTWLEAAAPTPLLGWWVCLWGLFGLFNFADNRVEGAIDRYEYGDAITIQGAAYLGFVLFWLLSLVVVRRMQAMQEAKRAVASGGSAA